MGIILPAILCGDIMKSPKLSFIISFILTAAFLMLLAFMAVADNIGLFSGLEEDAFSVNKTVKGTEIKLFNETFTLSNSITKPITSLYEAGYKFYVTILPDYIKNGAVAAGTVANKAIKWIPELAEKIAKKA